eukprot:7296156-Pyramimonas_sp.AAC.1
MPPTMNSAIPDEPSRSQLLPSRLAAPPAGRTAAPRSTCESFFSKPRRTSMWRKFHSHDVAARISIGAPTSDQTRRGLSRAFHRPLRESAEHDG